jgi:hypothetical protein
MKALFAPRRRVLPSDLHKSFFPGPPGFVRRAEDVFDRKFFSYWIDKILSCAYNP